MPETEREQQQQQQERDSIAARLPSRNVSYESAELVTVSELSKLGSTTEVSHPLLSAQNHLLRLVGSSVRVTGVIIYHNYHDNYIDIADPLTYNNSTNFSQFSTSTVISKDVKHPKLPHATISSSSKTMPSHCSNTASRSTIIPSTTPSNGTRKIFVKRKLPSEERRAAIPYTTTTTTTTNSTTPSSTAHASYLDKTKSSIRQLPFHHNPPKAHASHYSTSIRIDVTDVIPFDQCPSTTAKKDGNRNICGIGDLIMIVGEIQHIPQNPMSKHTEKNHNNNTDVVIVRARIARNVNGTNMKLFQEMLLVRRQFIRDRYYRSIDNDNNNNDDDDDDASSHRVRKGPGCGLICNGILK